MVSCLNFGLLSKRNLHRKRNNLNIQALSKFNFKTTKMFLVIEERAGSSLHPSYSSAHMPACMHVCMQVSLSSRGLVFLPTQVILGGAKIIHSCEWLCWINIFTFVYNWSHTVMVSRCNYSLFPGLSWYLSTPFYLLSSLCKPSLLGSCMDSLLLSLSSLLPPHFPDY